MLFRSPVAIPGELVRPSSESSQGLSVPRVRTPVLKRTRNTVRWHASSFISGFPCSSPAGPPVQQLKGPVWLEFRLGPQKCCSIRYHARWCRRHPGKRESPLRAHTRLLPKHTQEATVWLLPWELASWQPADCSPTPAYQLDPTQPTCTAGPDRLTQPALACSCFHHSVC